MTVNAFMCFLQQNCMHASDRPACATLLEAMQITQLEKQYCIGALDRRIQFIVPFLPHNRPPLGPDNNRFYCHNSLPPPPRGPHEQ